MTWMQRLKRVFAIDIETCPKCGGKLCVYRRVLKHGIEDPDVIEKILEHIRSREATTPVEPRAPPIRTRPPHTPAQDRLF